MQDIGISWDWVDGNGTGAMIVEFVVPCQIDDFSSSGCRPLGRSLPGSRSLDFKILI
jgi:hypothetical protein